MAVDIFAGPTRASNDPLAALSFQIGSLQLPDGSFASLELDYSNGRLTRLSDIFATALVAWLVSYSRKDAIGFNWLNKTLDYLERQRDPIGLWAFRGRSGEFPPDLDDTSVALLALMRFGRIDSGEAGVILHNFSQKESGLLGTWAIGSHRSDVVDLTANAHAVLALFEAGLRDERLEIGFLTSRAGPRHPFQSPYYCTSLPCDLARACYLGLVYRSSSLVRRAAIRLNPALAGIANESDLMAFRTSRQTWPAAGKVPLYRRRRLQVVYTSDAALLAYRFHLACASQKRTMDGF